VTPFWPAVCALSRPPSNRGTSSIPNAVLRSTTLNTQTTTPSTAARPGYIGLETIFDVVLKSLLLYGFKYGFYSACLLRTSSIQISFTASSIELHSCASFTTSSLGTCAGRQPLLRSPHEAVRRLLDIVRFFMGAHLHRGVSQVPCPVDSPRSSRLFADLFRFLEELSASTDPSESSRSVFFVGQLYPYPALPAPS
jgi:hypothetical protein